MQKTRVRSLGLPWFGKRHSKKVLCWTSLMAQMVKHLSAMLKTQVWSLGREDPLEKEMATHSSTFAWKIPWTEEPGRLYSPWGCKESDTTEWLYLYLFFFFTFFYLCLYLTSGSWAEICWQTESKNRKGKEKIPSLPFDSGWFQGVDVMYGAAVIGSHLEPMKW